MNATISRRMMTRVEAYRVIDLPRGDPRLGCDRTGKPDPVANPRLSVATRYTLAPERVVREDVVTIAGEAEVADLATECGSFSAGGMPGGIGRVRLDTGAITRFDTAIDGGAPSARQPRSVRRPPLRWRS